MSESNAAHPAYLCVGGIIVDDIVLPNGETHMEVLGGGVSHAAAGMAVWDVRPGIFATVGYDLPARARQRLERDFDTQGLRPLDLPQARAWQLFEWDGRRTEIFRVELMRPFLDMPGPSRLPASYHHAKGIYLLQDGERIPPWRQAFPQAVLLWEPPQAYMRAENADTFRATLPLVDIVSPNALEARQVYGLDDAEALVQAMLADGAHVVALRRGAEGSLLGMEGLEGTIPVPPVPVPEVVDQTGAGNTYCGAFLVGWCETHTLQRAGCYGAVAASFALEVIGVADPPPNKAEIRAQRYQWVCEHMGVAP